MITYLSHMHDDHPLPKASAAAHPSVPSSAGNSHFHRLEVLEGPAFATPPPSEARALLARLASDPGIASSMRAHRFTVGLLGELPPEGKVGVSPICLLGLNVRRGEAVLLRLRTDDLKGFRRYLDVRDCLVHELCHNVHGVRR